MSQTLIALCCEVYFEKASADFARLVIESMIEEKLTTREKVETTYAILRRHSGAKLTVVQ